MSQNARIFFISFIVFIGHNFIKAQQIRWSPEISLKSGANGSNTRPRIVALDDQRGIMIWGNEQAGSIQYIWWDENGISNPLKVEIKNHQAFVTDWASTEIAGKDQYVYIVFKENPAETGHVYLLKSTDYGQTFGLPISVVKPDSFYCRFPGIAIDDNYNPIISFMRLETDWSKPEYVSMRSTDGGQNFGPLSNFGNASIGEACDCCPVNIIADKNRLAILYRNNRNNIRNMAVAISNDLGDTFDQVSELDTADWFLQSCPSTGGDAFFHNDYLHTCWMTGRKSSNRVYYSRYNMTTKNVDIIVAMQHNVGRNLQQNYPRMAGNGDSIFLVWQELVNSNDIFFTYRTSNQQDLISPTIRLNSQTAGAQANPDIAFQNEKIYVCWQDEQDYTIKLKTGTFDITSQTQTGDKSKQYIIYSNGMLKIIGLENVRQMRVIDAFGRMIYSKENTNEILISLNVGQIFFIEVIENSGLNQTYTLPLVVTR